MMRFFIFIILTFLYSATLCAQDPDENERLLGSDVYGIDPVDENRTIGTKTDGFEVQRGLGEDRPGYRSEVTRVSQNFYYHAMGKMMRGEELTWAENLTVGYLIATRRWPDAPDITEQDRSIHKWIDTHPDYKDAIAGHLAGEMQALGGKFDQDIPLPPNLEKLRQLYHSTPPDQRSFVMNSLMNWYRAQGHDLRSNEAIEESRKRGEKLKQQKIRQIRNKQITEAAKKLNVHAGDLEKFFNCVCKSSGGSMGGYHEPGKGGPCKAWGALSSWHAPMPISKKVILGCRNKIDWDHYVNDQKIFAEMRRNDQLVYQKLQIAVKEENAKSVAKELQEVKQLSQDDETLVEAAKLFSTIKELLYPKDRDPLEKELIKKLSLSTHSDVSKGEMNKAIKTLELAKELTREGSFDNEQLDNQISKLQKWQKTWNGIKKTSFPEIYNNIQNNQIVSAKKNLQSIDPTRLGAPWSSQGLASTQDPAYLSLKEAVANKENQYQEALTNTEISANKMMNAREPQDAIDILTKFLNSWQHNPYTRSSFDKMLSQAKGLLEYAVTTENAGDEFKKNADYAAAIIQYKRSLSTRNSIVVERKLDDVYKITQSTSATPTKEQTASGANHAGGYWGLVKIKGSVGRECTSKEISNDYYGATISGKEGDVTIAEMVRKENHTHFSARGTWQRPPDILYPDSIINIPLSIKKIVEDTSQYWRGMSIYIDTWDMKCGSTGGGGEIGYLKIDHKSPKSISETIQWKVKKAFYKKAGEKLTIRVCYTGVSICGEKGWKYHYEWVPENSNVNTPLAKPTQHDNSTSNNLLINGDFEQGSTVGRYATLHAGSNDLDGWSIDRATIDVVGSEFRPASGNRSIDMCGTPGCSTLTQTITTQKGATYSLVFYLSGNTYAGKIKTLEVKAGNKKRTFTFDISGKSKTDMQWRREVMTFQALGDKTKISFIAPDKSNHTSAGPAIDNVQIKRVAPTSAASSTTIKDTKITSKYIGCYKEKGHDERVVPSMQSRAMIGYTFGGDMTTRKCTDACSERGFKYAGLQYANDCFCDNDYGEYGKADNCNMPCTGNNNEMCGGAWSNSVYELGNNNATEKSANTVNYPESQTAIKLINNVPRQNFSAIKRNVDNRLRMQTTSWDKVPYRMAPVYLGTIRLNPNRRAVLAGNAAGTTGWSVDNFLLIELSSGGSATLLVVGNHEPVTMDGSTIQKIGRDSQSFGAGEIDLTPYIQSGRPTKLRVTAFDYGGMGKVSDVYLVMK